MSDDSNRYKDALRRSLEGLRQPNPLEVLKFSPELVQALDPEALAVAARGLANALKMAYHPDRASRRQRNSTEKLQQVMAAKEAIEADPAKVRRAFLDAERAKRTRKPTSEVAADLTLRQKQERDWAAREASVLEMLNVLYGPESITRAKGGHLLLRPVSIYPALQSELPKGAAAIKDGKTTIQPMRYFTTIDSGSPEVMAAIEELNPPDGGAHLMIPEADRTIVVSSGNRGTYETGPSSVLTPGNWYELRGTKGDNKHDPRSIIVYKPEGAPEPYTLWGCVSADTAKWLQNTAISALTGKGMAEHFVLKSGGNEQVPAKFRIGSIISTSIWENLASGNLATQKHVLTPQIKPFEILIGENTEGTKLILGAVEHVGVDYY